jgi:hypothetical protein
MKAAAYRNTMSEDQFTDTVIQLAKLRGWMVVHHRPARTERGWRTLVQGDTGLPDIILARGGIVWFVELKSARGQLREDQKRWREHLGEHHLLWRPADLPLIREFLI